MLHRPEDVADGKGSTFSVTLPRTLRTQHFETANS
jgi:hypothetical protein